MNKSDNVHLAKTKYYICVLILLSILLTDLLYIKNSPFPRNIFTSDTEFITIVTTNSTSYSSTTDINEVLCNNMSNYQHQENSDHPCEKIRCAISIHETGGRLGNLMFIFASAYGLARTHGCRLYAPDQIMQDLSSSFNLSIQKDLWLSAGELNTTRNFVVKDTVCSFLPEMLRPNAFKYIELQGYWQSYLYFDGYRDEIRRMYSARSETLKKLFGYFSNITRNDCPTCSIPLNTSANEFRQIIRTNYNITWIGIHMRLTDFLRLGFASKIYYIHRAMSYYKRRFYNQKIRFLLASDDKRFCEKLFSMEIQSHQIFLLPIIFSRADDLMALSFCHHSIITGGTYSFWAGYLAGGEVIHDTAYSVACSRSEYYPSWFKLISQTKTTTADQIRN